MNQHANDLTNCAMHGLDDRVGGRSVRGDVDGLDSSVVEGELKVMSGKFGTMIMNDSEGTGVAS